VRKKTPNPTTSSQSSRSSRGLWVVPLRPSDTHSRPRDNAQFTHEFDFRFSTCELTDIERMEDLGARMSVRLSYEMITA
jgi:hypothetical protein